MHVTRLAIRNLRRFADVELRPGPGVNLLVGGNGAGKTSVLEALHLMAYGRSFRGRVRDGLIRCGAPSLEIFVQWQEGVSGHIRKAGLRHAGQHWSGRLDGESVKHLGDLCAALAVVSFEPGSHALITGGGEYRRRFLDWGLFHVEPTFLQQWRRYARALKQRNALLKRRGPSDQLDAWDRELAESGEPLSRERQRYQEALQPYFSALINEWAAALGEVRLEYLPGWRHDEVSLADALLLARDRDLSAGFTSVGPHRADWRIVIERLPGRTALSRGQAKITALSALMAQAEHYSATKGQWPVMLMDDLASELDRDHQRRVLDRLQQSRAQIFITGTEPPSALIDSQEVSTFHVKHGEIMNLDEYLNP